MREKTVSASTIKSQSHTKRVAGKAKSAVKSGTKPLKKVYSKKPSLPQNKLTLAIGKIFSPVKKVLKKLAPTYFVHAWREVKLVTWPSRRETWRLTLAVFIFSIVFGAAAYAVDSLLDKIFRTFVLK